MTSHTGNTGTPDVAAPPSGGRPVGSAADHPDAPLTIEALEAALNRLLGEVRPAPEWGPTEVSDFLRRAAGIYFKLEKLKKKLLDDLIDAVFVKAVDRLKQSGHVLNTPPKSRRSNNARASRGASKTIQD